ncbi:MAG: IS481 family transposase, partial [Holosporaceae bacterium]|nr:IS481 family transposase [Holosporaceae bacterium]MDR3156110.1 IS481 family transposase [Holosporaceae bacterium]
RLKTLKGMTPYEFVINSWKNNPNPFIIIPTLHNMGPYT